MSRKPLFYIFLTLSLLCLLLALLLTSVQYSRYQQSRAVLPPGTVIAGVPVGGLPAQAAGERIAQAYSRTPVELRYDGHPIHLDPLAAGQSLDINSMLRSATEIAGVQNPIRAFWDFLWNRPRPTGETPLICTVDEVRLRSYLEGLLLPRYSRPATQATPVPGDVSFIPGRPGQTLDIENTLPAVREAMCSLTDRIVEIRSIPAEPLPPSIDQLRAMLETLVQVSAFDGTFELYYQDLASGEEIRLAFHEGRPVEPGIAFTAASTIKIPVMVSAYKRLDGELPADLQQKMAEMIDLSDNASTDAVMQRVMDANIAPVQVTQDLQMLGLQNTFLAGFFFPGAPLLDRYETPANRRGDISTDPDIYNQTTAADMGMLLAEIQRCAEDGNGILAQTFDGQITQGECQSMVDLLSKNRKGVLIEAGVPEGTNMAHKYGWVTDPEDGLMHQASDASIVYTPGGDFVLAVYLSHPEQLQWDPAQRLVARLTTGIYNFYNQWR